MPCLVAKSGSTMSPVGLLFPTLVLGLLKVTSLEVISCHNPRELHTSSTCWFPVGEELGAFL